MDKNDKSCDVMILIVSASLKITNNNDNNNNNNNNNNNKDDEEVFFVTIENFWKNPRPT